MYQEYPIPTISSLGEGSNSTPGPLELWSSEPRTISSSYRRPNVHLKAFPLKRGCAPLVGVVTGAELPLPPDEEEEEEELGDCSWLLNGSLGGEGRGR